MLSALQLGPCRHLSPSASVIRDPATVQQAGPLNPSFMKPPESPRARPHKLARESTLEPAWVGSGHLAKQLASPTQQPLLLRSLAGILSWRRKHGERASYLGRPATRTHAPATNSRSPYGRSLTNLLSAWRAVHYLNLKAAPWTKAGTSPIACFAAGHRTLHKADLHRGNVEQRRPLRIVVGPPTNISLMIRGILSYMHGMPG